MNTLIIEPSKEVDYQLFVNLAKRLKVKFREDVKTEEEEAPSKAQILRELKEDYVALKNGTLKTRPVAEFLAELKDEGYL